MIPDPDLLYILPERASKDDQQGLIDRPDAKEQDDPDPVGGIVVEQRGKYEHEHDNEDAIDKDGLHPVQQQGVIVPGDVFFGEKVFFRSGLVRQGGVFHKNKIIHLPDKINHGISFFLFIRIQPRR